MPLKLVPPREGKSPYWTIRGTYLGRRIDKSSKARRRAVAEKALKKLERTIECGEFFVAGEPTFASAAADYLNAGGEERFLKPLLLHFKETVLSAIDQAAIDRAADKLHPKAPASTRNRQVYTPVSAVLRDAGRSPDLRRPKGHDGNKLTGWLWPEQAFRLFVEAGKLDAEFRLFCIFLLYAGGLRLSEGLAMEVGLVRLAESFAYVADSKNEDPRPLFLPAALVVELANHPRGMDRTGKLFKFSKNGHLYGLLKAAATGAGIKLPRRQAFHVFCHTYATWMRRFGGLDTKGLQGTGRWKDRKSVDRYEHVVASEDARRAELLPVAWKIRGKRRSGGKK